MTKCKSNIEFSILRDFFSRKTNPVKDSGGLILTNVWEQMGVLTALCPESTQSRVVVVVSLSSDEGSRTQMPPAGWTFMMIIKHVLYVPEVKS